jgi:cytochrome c oxidase subunit 2
MEKIIIAVIAVIFLLILFFIFRVVKLLAQSKPKKDSRTAFLKGNKLSASLLLGFMIVGLGGMVFYTYKASVHFLPEPASVHGDEIDRMFNWTLLITGIVFFLTQILLFYYSYRYQYKPGRNAFYYPINYTIEFFWTAIPTVTFIGLFYFGFISWKKIMKPATEDSIPIEVLGQQFSWMVRYPGPDGELGTVDYRNIDPINQFGLRLTDKNGFDDFMPMQLHLPKGIPVELKIRARDVLHSVFLPHFRVKMDAVPGMPTRFNFTAKYTTEEMREITGNPGFDYELACTELCGRGHFAMRFLVVVEEPEAFWQWYEGQESWLAKNPEYLEMIPANLRELAYNQVESAND